MCLVSVGKFRGFGVWGSWGLGLLGVGVWGYKGLRACEMAPQEFESGGHLLNLLMTVRSHNQTYIRRLQDPIGKPLTTPSTTSRQENGALGSTHTRIPEPLNRRP